ncbi:MAG: winged helix-turn-helix transcriptional regulator [Verrucomicrobia bacterium]|nr:winged helix-turn-helix transcriptional regulator [Verrucomicrobiota bacterium]
MLVPVFRDLIKPAWRSVLEELKLSGGMSVSELARKTGGSYMAVKAHCEALTKSGYLIRTRLPPTAIGRPEIFYSLAAKADALFPQAGVDFTLELLNEIKLMFGASTPDKLLFLYFQKQLERLGRHLDVLQSTTDRKSLRCAKKRAARAIVNAIPEEPFGSWNCITRCSVFSNATRGRLPWNCGCSSNGSAPAWSVANSPEDAKLRREWSLRFPKKIIVVSNC